MDKVVKKAAHIMEEVTEKTDSPKEWKWWMEGTLNCGSTAGDKESDKLALFDMDGTLIHTKSGKTNPINWEDWILWNPKVPQKLKEEKAKGYRIVIVSNQKGISLGHTTAQELRKKVEALSKVFGVEMSCFMATDDDQYRKPNLGIWKYLTSSHNKIAINKADSVIFNINPSISLVMLQVDRLLEKQEQKTFLLLTGINLIIKIFCH